MPDEILEGSPEGGTPTPKATDTPTPTPSPTPVPVQATDGDADKRFRGIQADLAKERKQRQDYERRVTQYETELATERRRVQALSGVNPQSPDEADREEVRQRFAALYPELAGLSKEDIDTFREMAKERAGLAETTNHYWQAHGRKMVGEVQKEITKEYGGELSARQVETITKAYVLRAQSDPAFLQRHEDGDPALASEFAKEWLADWFEPAKRKATQTQVDQFRRVPGGKDRSSTFVQGEKKIDVNDPKAVEDMLVAGFRERGGTFGRR